MSKKKKLGAIGALVLIVAVATVATGAFIALKGLTEEFDFDFADDADNE